MSSLADTKISEDLLKENITQYRVYDNSPENEKYLLMQFMVFHIRNELAAMCEKKISIEKAAFLINEKWQRELNRG